ncbi:MAG: hypothetical protein EPN79_11910 [Burkholderiaceae bacterium]|nr:MAG: hypothetical protein EPN79_11910 [Burkholderiaceae bacterium]TBR76871.1 MAG: hypothetical protein EPN64_06520 [Burkholderiaceae bacterium]
MSEEKLNIGERIEDYALHGASASPLEPSFRQKAIDYIAGFEECESSKDELAAKSDGDLMDYGYHVMAEYANGQD